MKTNLFLLACFVVLASSCSNDEETEFKHPNIGSYDLISLRSNIPMDLNYDGFENTDFKTELSDYWFNSFQSVGIVPLEITEMKHLNYDDVIVLYPELLGMPRDDYNPFNDFVATRFKGYLKVLQIHVKGNDVMSIEKDQYQSLSSYSSEELERLPKINIFNFDDENTITLEISQQFFDVWEHEWKSVSLVAKFKKIKDPMI